MNMNLFRHFEQQMTKGNKLCIMPISRVLIERHIVDPIPGYVLCPPGSVDLAALRVVWDPASAWANNEAHLGWAKAASTQVSKDDFRKEASIAFAIDFIDWDAFLDGDHEFHLDVLRQSSEKAEHLMDLVRLHYCRMDLPDTLPGRVSMLGDGTPFSCGLYYSLQDHESYLIAGQVMQVARVGGLGLDFDSVTGLDVVTTGETGNVARRGLALFTQALEANYLSSKFAQCFVVLEFLASPDEFESMSKAKTKIGAHVAKDKAGYHAFCQEIEYLHKDLRTKIVHGGMSFEQAVPDQVERTRIFRRFQQLIGVTLKDLIEHAEMPWVDFQKYRDRRLHELGVKVS